MQPTKAALAKAQRQIGAIDMRLDALRDELRRQRPGFDDTSAHGWQRAWDSVPGLQTFDRALFARRGEAQERRDAALAVIADRERRAELRRPQGA